MPAISVPLDPETNALMGNFKAAAQAIEREWKDLQRQIQKDIAAGNAPDRNTAARALELGERRESYLAQDKLKKAAAEAADKSTSKALANLLNTHNPHGRVRQLLSSRPSVGAVGSLGEGLKSFAGSGPFGRLAASIGGGIEQGAANIAGVAMLAGMATRAVFEVMQHKADSELSAAKMDLAGNSRDFVLAKSLKYDTGATQALTTRQRNIAGARTEDFGTINTFLDGTENAAHARDFQRHIEDFRLKHQGRINAQAIERASNSHALRYSGAVERQLGIIEKGTLGWLWSQTVGRATGSREAEREKLAHQMALKQLSGLEKHLDDDRRQITENPTYHFVQAERGREINAWRSFQMERFQQWNQN